MQNEKHSYYNKMKISNDLYALKILYVLLAQANDKKKKKISSHESKALELF